MKAGAGIILCCCIALLPSVSSAATDCRYVEYSDHYEAVCTGDAVSGDPRVENNKAVGPIAHGKHRPPGRYMEAERAARLELMMDSRRKAALGRHENDTEVK